MALDSPKPSPNSVRLQKYIAHCGVASRRAAEALIRQGRVAVDGHVVTEMGVSVNPRVQTVAVDGRPVKRESFAYILLNKPRNILCTCRDPQGRLTFQELLPDLPVRVYSVGRLDMDSEGLLLLTNDGELANRLAHPRHHVEKTYQVWASAPLDPAVRERMTGEGVESEGERLRMLSITPGRETRAGWMHTVVLGEGKKRQIRRMFAEAGAKVLRLRRVAMGPLKLGEIQSGAWRHLTGNEVERLKNAACQNSSKNEISVETGSDDHD